MYRLVCLVAVIWSVNDYFYIAGSLNAENLHGDIWLNFSLVALTELPAVFVGTFLMGNYPLQRHISVRDCHSLLQRGWAGAGCTAAAWCWPRCLSWPASPWSPRTRLPSPPSPSPSSSSATWAGSSCGFRPWR